jgi:hypothetical protein
MLLVVSSNLSTKETVTVPAAIAYKRRSKEGLRRLGKAGLWEMNMKMSLR